MVGGSKIGTGGGGESQQNCPRKGKLTLFGPVMHWGRRIFPSIPKPLWDLCIQVQDLVLNFSVGEMKMLKKIQIDIVNCVPGTTDNNNFFNCLFVHFSSNL